MLAVIDEQMRAKIEDLRAWMYWPPTPGPRVIVIHAKPTSNAPPGADRDHSNGGILDGEQILFHDDGHILADALKIHTNNKSIQEFVAGIFMIAYIRAQRPDMNFIVERLERILAGSTASLKYSSIC